MSNVIVNDCIGGYLYRFSNKQFPNPFIWTAIGFESFIYLIRNYDTIDFENYEIVRHPSDIRLFNIVLDENIIIKCPHWLFDIHYSKPTIVDSVNIKYKRIWLYIKNKFETRTQRLMTSNEKPIFIMDFKDWLDCDITKLQNFLSNCEDIKYPLYIVVPYIEYKDYRKGNVSIIYDEFFNDHSTEYRAKVFLDKGIFKV